LVSLFFEIQTMTVRQPSARNLRRWVRKNPTVKVGPRVFVIFIILAVLLGAIAISVNLKVEKRESAPVSHQNL
jgi:hypothetical protein